MSVSRPRFGGLGALFFLGTLGAISVYVQRQAGPSAPDAIRKPATNLPSVTEEAEETVQRAPWRDRLDMSSMKLHALGTTSGPAARDKGLAAMADSPSGTLSGARDVDPDSGLFVQDLGDGHRLLYTLDPVMQDGLTQIFSNREVPYAAAVVLDLRDNSVLAMVGHSSMDTQVDPLEVTGTAWAPAASTFKLVTAAALLDKGISPGSKTCYHGGLRGITDDLLVDNPAKDDICNTLSTAVAKSINVVIAKQAMNNLSEDELVGMAKALKFESEIDFEFPVEPSPANIPSDEKERAKVAAGFWQVDTSPIHNALLASIFARGGMYQPPHILADILGPDGEHLTPELTSGDRVISKRVADEMREMMRRTTEEGTARGSFRDKKGSFYLPITSVAGKTGSLTGRRAPALNYNWFIGFAPAEQPEIAFAIVLANPAKWRIKAHYVGRRVVQMYLGRRNAITAHRSARLTATGIELPERDPATGAFVATNAKISEQSSPTKATDGPQKGANELPSLPPVPGPLPTPELKTVVAPTAADSVVATPPSVTTSSPN